MTVSAFTPLTDNFCNFPAQVITSWACRMAPRAEMLALAIATLTQSTCVSTVANTMHADAQKNSQKKQVVLTCLHPGYEIQKAQQ
jgi:hypothetical protein